LPKDQEIEVKFYLNDLERLRERVLAAGAVKVSERVLETNLRFDTATHYLARNGQALRLRQDAQARLTFKGPAKDAAGARARREIEFTVGDFESARQFIEALGYEISLIYEKYRTTYKLEDVEIVLDELPYGNFAELEGDHPARIRSLGERLGLDWSRRIGESYTVLFDAFKGRRGLVFRDLSFQNFRGLACPPEDLGVKPADERLSTD
jgi:adenylate cyclase class 2